MSFLTALTRAARVCFACAIFSIPAVLPATDYYVDPSLGDDANSGLAPEEAWRSLDRVSNAQELKPGDVVRFKAGEKWRGNLHPRSGAEGNPILYTSWGEGAKPSFWGSISLADENAWTRVDENVWGTREPKIERLGDAPNFFRGGYGLHQEGGAKASFEKRGDGFVLSVEKGSDASNRIQLCKGVFSVEKGRAYRLSFDATASSDVNVPISLMKNSAPWSGYGAVLSGACNIGPDSRHIEIVYRATETADDARITFYFGRSPDGLRAEFSNFRADEVAYDAFEMGPDVGNIILDSPDGKKAGFKRWTREDMTEQDDFMYERETGRVLFYSKENPAKTHKFIEAAIMKHVVSHSGVSDVIFDGLDVRYGAAHGFGGSNAKRVIVRNCDVSWIGGGDQYAGGAEGRRVRFGNGIEYWTDASDVLVENCRIWEIYDAAITNQGNGLNTERDITYRGNLIWNSEYSFEYWNGGPESKTENITFADNICLNAGRGWGHVQRPDKNGRHLMFYGNVAQTKNFVISGNVFANAVDSIIRSDRQWTPEEARLDGNTYWQEDENVPYFWRWLKTYFKKAEFETLLKEGFDPNGKVEPVDVKALLPTDVD